MTNQSSTPDAKVEKHQAPGMHMITLPRAGCTEHFLTVTPLEGESPADTLGRASDLLQQTDSSVIAQDLFGAGTSAHAKSDLDGSSAKRCPVMHGAFGEITWPVTWIHEANNASDAFCGTQIWAVSGIDVESIEIDGKVVGRFFEDDLAQYCRLGGLGPASTSCSDEEQTQQVFDRMIGALSSVGMDFSNVVRTWFYNRDILSWYGSFNDVRDVFFREHGIFDGLVPASTGMGGTNVAGAALMSGLLAAKAKTDDLCARAVASPLQNPALDYGSSFSRATELDVPGLRRIFVSGTASIAEEGHTQFVGDMDGQVARTMEVVRAILNSRDMDWEDVTRFVAYYKMTEDADAFGRYCEKEKVPDMPVVRVNNDVCRDDLLFEIELDAVSCG
ncbi:MAG: hypothetical protein GY851_35895 [bacterium]|nr:hypothetical protein [bacterium]